MAPRYETTPIRGEKMQPARNEHDVAADVTDAYTKAAQNGGRIIAGHVMPIDSQYAGAPVLLLVAEYPDEV